MIAPTRIILAKDSHWDVDHWNVLCIYVSEPLIKP